MTHHLSELRETRAGSLLLSWDFGAALVIGGAASAAPTLSDAISKAVPSVLLTATGVSAGILAFALAAVSFLAFFLDAEFLRLVRQANGGADGLRETYLAVAVIAGAATSVTLAVALLWPALEGASWKLQAPVFSCAALFFLWAVFGAVQLVELSLSLASKREQFNAHVEQVRKLQAQRRVG